MRVEDADEAISRDAVSTFLNVVHIFFPFLVAKISPVSSSVYMGGRRTIYFANGKLFSKAKMSSIVLHISSTVASSRKFPPTVAPTKVKLLASIAFFKTVGLPLGM